MAFYDLDVRFPFREGLPGELGFKAFCSPFELKDFGAQGAGKLKARKGLVVAASQDIEWLRRACKSRDVGMLFNEGFVADVGLIRDAADAMKPFEVPVAPLLESSGVRRAMILARMRFFLKVCLKLKAPFAIVSHARDEFGLKSPGDMVSIGQALGLEQDQAEWCISEIPEMVLNARC